jgi:hypothetical protein
MAEHICQFEDYLEVSRITCCGCGQDKEVAELEAELDRIKPAAQAVVDFFNGECTCVNNLEAALEAKDG